MSSDRYLQSSKPLPLGEVLIQGCRCRCGHEWAYGSANRPQFCPKCKSEDWDKHPTSSADPTQK